MFNHITIIYEIYHIIILIFYSPLFFEGYVHLIIITKQDYPIVIALRVKIIATAESNKARA